MGSMLGFGMVLGSQPRNSANLGPVNVTPPAIAGDAPIGSVLTRTAGSWTGTGTVVVQGQWLRNGTPISGETGATYTTVTGDAGATISYRETATDDEGMRSLSSNGIAAGVAPSATLNVNLNGRTVEVWLTSVAGSPMASRELSQLIVGGVDRTAEVTGNGNFGDRWQYTAPSEATALAVSVTARAFNGATPDWTATDTSLTIPAEATLAITATRSTAAQFAPEAVWFDATTAGFSTSTAPANSIVYDPDFHEIHYFWSFDDTGDSFDVPTNLLTAHRDANRAEGKHCAHVFRGPGTYTVTCDAVHITQVSPLVVETATSTIDITVADPDTVFDATNTVVVAHDDDFTGAPASNHQLGSSAITGGSAWYQYTQGASITKNQPLRVLFKRGGDYSNADIGCCHRVAFGDYSAIYYGAWGSGAKPVFQNRTRAFHEGRPGIWDNIHFRQTYNAETEAGGGVNAFSPDKNAYHLLTGCDFSNAEVGLSFQNITNAADGLNVLHDCSFYELEQYGVFHKGQPENWDGNGHKIRFAMLGCMEVDTGDQPQGVNSVNGQKQGSMRGFVGEDVYIQATEFFVRTGWTAQGTWGDGTDKTAIQPSIRFSEGAPSGGTGRNGDVIVTGCVSEGGGLIDANYDDDASPALRNMLISQSVVTAAPTTTGFAKFHSGALTVRDCLFTKPVVAGTNTINGWLEFGGTYTGTHSPTQRYAEPIRIHNNSFMLLDASAVTNDFYDLGDWTSVTQVNNLFYVEGNTGQTRHEAFAPFNATTLWAPRYLGRREWNSDGTVLEALQTQFVSPADTISLRAPTAGSSALSGGTGLVSRTDITGALKADVTARGAVSEGAVAGEAPEVVFSGVSEAAMYDMSDTDTFAPNVDGSGTATLDGTVRWLEDKLGNGHHATNDVNFSPNWPIWRNNGVDHLEMQAQSTAFAALHMPFGPAQAGFAAVVCMERHAADDNEAGMLSSDDNAGNRAQIIFDDPTNTAAIRVNSTIATSDINITDPAPAHVFSMVYDGTTFQLWIDGVLKASITGQTITASMANWVINRDRYDAGGRFGGRYYRAAIGNKVITPSERESLEAWAAAPAGITLP